MLIVRDRKKNIKLHEEKNLFGIVIIGVILSQREMVQPVDKGEWKKKQDMSELVSQRGAEILR